jgi:hypothetical protein
MFYPKKLLFKRSQKIKNKLKKQEAVKIKERERER